MKVRRMFLQNLILCKALLSLGDLKWGVSSVGRDLYMHWQRHNVGFSRSTFSLVPAWHGHSFHRHHVARAHQDAVPCPVLQHHHHPHWHFWWNRWGLRIDLGPVGGGGARALRWLQHGKNTYRIIQGLSSLPVSSFHQSMYWVVGYKTNKRGPKLAQKFLIIDNHPQPNPRNQKLKTNQPTKQPLPLQKPTI